MWWHANRNNVILTVYLIKLGCQIASMAIKNQEVVFSSYTATISGWNKDILKPFKSDLIRCPSIWMNFNPPILW